MHACPYPTPIVLILAWSIQVALKQKQTIGILGAFPSPRLSLGGGKATRTRGKKRCLGGKEVTHPLAPDE